VIFSKRRSILFIKADRIADPGVGFGFYRFPLLDIAAGMSQSMADGLYLVVLSASALGQQ
jgi:hypothetical protein